ncbi:hypothetical protein EI983_16405 [Roseovarius faecimaris]|uniref:Zinc-finger domain-containing protein n=1 Tax=Roseovarius faecimaris TaxID=2494550 RepID=A0A6I6IU80_9RHOB|nr:hypothetical protein [Roseovarius faecimaris]QGX99762.1 hypothetical protein EI983_16405 [Roseovarius faecimaris]
MSTLSDKERQELSLLLPWYANGTLDDDDTRKVEAALAEDDALAREFDLVLEDQASVVALVSEEEVPISMGERFKAALTAETAEPVTRVQPRARDESLISRITSVLFPARPRAYAYVAAAIVLLVPAIAILSVVNGNQQPGRYQTASGEVETATDKQRMLVKFSSEVAWTDVDTFLRATRGQIVRGPNADGLYELEFEKTEELATTLENAAGLFEFVLPSN